MFNYALTRGNSLVPAYRPILSTIESVAQTALRRLAEWRERSRGRRMLATLDDRMLSDIGVDRATADRESSTVFWRT